MLLWAIWCVYVFSFVVYPIALISLLIMPRQFMTDRYAKPFVWSLFIFATVVVAIFGLPKLAGATTVPISQPYVDATTTATGFIATVFQSQATTTLDRITVWASQHPGYQFTTLKLYQILPTSTIIGAGTCNTGGSGTLTTCAPYGLTTILSVFINSSCTVGADTVDCSFTPYQFQKDAWYILEIGNYSGGYLQADYALDLNFLGTYLNAYVQNPPDNTAYNINTGAPGSTASMRFIINSSSVSANTISLTFPTSTTVSDFSEWITSVNYLGGYDSPFVEIDYSLNNVLYSDIQSFSTSSLGQIDPFNVFKSIPLNPVSSSSVNHVVAQAFLGAYSSGTRVLLATSSPVYFNINYTAPFAPGSASSSPYSTNLPVIGRFVDLWDTIKVRPPIGFFFSAQGTLLGFNASSTPTSTESIFSYADSYFQDQSLGGPGLFDELRVWLKYILFLTLLFYFFIRLTRFSW